MTDDKPKERREACTASPTIAEPQLARTGMVNASSNMIVCWY